MTTVSQFKSPFSGLIEPVSSLHTDSLSASSHYFLPLCPCHNYHQNTADQAVVLWLALSLTGMLATWPWQREDSQSNASCCNTDVFSENSTCLAPSSLHFHFRKVFLSDWNNMEERCVFFCHWKLSKCPKKSINSALRQRGIVSPVNAADEHKVMEV